MKKRGIIADEADLMLIGIKTILKEQSLWEIVHTARSASELIETSKALLPDVIVFNERLDQLIDVLVIVERLKQATPRSRLIVLGSLKVCSSAICLPAARWHTFMKAMT